MSAEILRRAATKILSEFVICECGECVDEPQTEARFHLAVAEWLEGQAAEHASYSTSPGAYSHLRPIRFEPALAVARAYLGET